MNESRNSIHNKSAAVHRSLCGLVLSSFIVQVAYADVGLPPPAVHQSTNNGFPSSQALQRQGYDPSTGVLRVSESNHGSSVVTKSGDTITGTQNKTVTVTGRYGEKATMSTTSTQRVSANRLGTAANVAILGSISSQNQTQNANKLGAQIRDGDFGGALGTVANMAGQAVNNLLGGIPSGTADGYSGLADLRNNSVDTAKLLDIARQSSKKQAQAERAGDLGGALAQAAVQKAANAAANTAQKVAGATTSGKQLAEASRNKDGSYSQLFLRRIDIKSGSNINPKPIIEGYTYQIDRNRGIYNWQNSSFASWYQGKSLPQGYDYVSGVFYSPITSDKEYQEALRKVAGQSSQEQQKTVDDMTLNAKDIQSILERMLESQNTNHKELMNQLSKIGNTVEEATTSKEFGAAEAYSEPYTPQGSNTPQQTKFSVDKSGNVTATTIQRPDLKANSSQAPTRTSVIPNKTGDSAQAQEQGNETVGKQENQQQNFCKENPKSAACAELGEVDYEDLTIPQQTIDLNFQPSSHFSTTGTCPMPRSVDFGMFGIHEFSYEPLCDFAAKIRPILIAITILSCAWFVSGSLKEV